VSITFGEEIRIWKYTEHSDIVYAVAVDSDGYIYSACWDNEVHKIDPDGNNVWKYTEYSGSVYAVALDSDGYVYSGSVSYDGVHKIDPDGSNVWKYTEHTGTVRAVAVDSDGYIYSGSVDNEVHKIDPDGNNVWKYTEHSDIVRAVAVDSDGYVYTASQDNEVHKIDPDGNNVWKYTEHSGGVYAVALDSDGYVYSGSTANEVHKIDPDGNNVWKYTEHTGDVYAVAVDSDGYVYTASQDDEVHKIDPDGNNVWKYTGHTGNVFAVALDSDGYIYTASLDEEVHKIQDNYKITSAYPSIVKVRYVRCNDVEVTWDYYLAAIEISTKEELQKIGVHESFPMDAHYKLMNDIDLEGENIKPIGGLHETTLPEEDRFKGILDGNGYKIHNGEIKHEGKRYIALIAHGDGCKIKNLGIENVDVKGSDDVVGCLVGLTDYDYTEIENCYSTGNVEGDQFVGGLVGYNCGVIKQSYAVGDVEGRKHVGGLSGINEGDGEILNCYAKGSVIVSEGWAGGLVGGSSWSLGSIENCYSTGSVSSVSNSGGLLGESPPAESVHNCYWDTETSGTETGIGEGEGDVEGKTTAEMQDIETFEPEWDIATKEDYDDEVWYIDDGNDYPRLYWELQPEKPEPEVEDIKFSIERSIDGGRWTHIGDKEGDPDYIRYSYLDVGVIDKVYGVGNVSYRVRTIEPGISRFSDPGSIEIMGSRAEIAKGRRLIMPKGVSPRIITKETDYTGYMEGSPIGVPYGTIGGATKGEFGKIYDIYSPEDFIRQLGFPMTESYSNLGAFMYLKHGNLLRYMRIGDEEKAELSEVIIEAKDDEDPPNKRDIVRITGDTKGTYFDKVSVEVSLVDDLTSEEEGEYKQNQFSLTVYYDGRTVESYPEVSLVKDDHHFIVAELEGSRFIKAEALEDLADEGLEEDEEVVTGMYYLDGGDDGYEDLESSDYIDAIEGFKHEEIVDIRTFSIPDCMGRHKDVIRAMEDLAEFRQDVAIFIDTPEEYMDSLRLTSRWHNGYLGDSTDPENVDPTEPIDHSYLGIYYPWVIVNINYLRDHQVIPPSSVVAGAYARSYEMSQPWFAHAGVSRGLIDVVDVVRNLNKEERHQLYTGDNRINSIIAIKNLGVMIYGNRTAQSFPTVRDRMNVRMLLLETQSVVKRVSREIKFEPHDEDSWENWTSRVEDYMDKVKENRGVYWYDVRLNITEEDIKLGRLPAKIFISPTRTIEEITIEFVLTDEDVEFS